MTFHYSANFNAVPLGPFTTAAKTTAWGVAPAFDGDPTGGRYSIVTGGRNGGQCCQCFFPQGQNGTSQEEYQMFRDASGVVVNVEFDWKALAGFDFTKDVGKIGPSICWGPRSGSSGGVMSFINWTQQKTGAPAKFLLVIQNQANGTDYATPGVYSAAINIGQWYHWKIQMLGGSGGYVTAWLDGAQFASYANTGTWPTGISDTVMFDDYYHYGGAGPGPSVNCYALQDNIQYYSGSAPQAAITQAVITLQ